jgi:hypothetical protein
VTRRDFFHSTLAAAAVSAASAEPLPWYRRTLRWGQTNITERDPPGYDIPWWREYWKRTAVEGVIINAGGIVAYYPSKFALHHRAEFLNGRDLYGELAQAAHEDGLAVLARMDSNRTAEDFFQAHPGWFARRQSGDPYRADDKYVTCVNSPYYDEYIPDILREIVERSHPEGFADNSWSGLPRNSICYCENCERRFRDQTGSPLPARKDWDSPAYRQWIAWSYARRVAIWDLNNRVTKAAGGPHCLWLGMNSGSITSQSSSLRDFREIAKRSEFLLLDHQSRNDATGFQQNADAGKLVHGLVGWDKTIIESMALYQVRVASKPEPEARLWMVEGIAGGIGPWWHMVGAFHDDRRMYRTPEKVFQWHRQHEQYLVNRTPVAAVGIVWSQRNTDFFGRDDAADLVDAPYRGFAQALLRARIPYLPLHADDIDSQGAGMAALVLPNLGALSDAQCASIRRFAERGGGVVASGAASLYDENGDTRRDFALAGLYGAHAPAPDFGRKPEQQAHTYLRLPSASERHAVLRGFDETDIIPYGGVLEKLRTDAGVVVPLTYIPPFPVFPPETAWMREPKTDIPGLVLNPANGRRVAWLAADIDRRYARNNLPDHGDLLANLVRWAAAGGIGFELRGAGLLDCQVYRQAGRPIVHVVNLTNEGAWRGPIDELIAVGPLAVRIRVPEDVRARKIECLVSGAKPALRLHQGWAAFELKSVLDHEVVVIS